MRPNRVNGLGCDDNRIPALGTDKLNLPGRLNITDPYDMCGPTNRAADFTSVALHRYGVPVISACAGWGCAVTKRLVAELRELPPYRAIAATGVGRAYHCESHSSNPNKGEARLSGRETPAKARSGGQLSSFRRGNRAGGFRDCAADRAARQTRQLDLVSADQRFVDFASLTVLCLGQTLPTPRQRRPKIPCLGAVQILSINVHDLERSRCP